MANKPVKSSIGWKYEVISFGVTYRVEGPGLNNSVTCFDKEDAETIAAALNFATNFDKIRLKAEQLRDYLHYLTEFKA